jgi:hypothetical protein
MVVGHGSKVNALPIVWICGPPGVGKSAVGWQLFARWAWQDRTVAYVDIDQLAMRQPPNTDPDADTRRKAANLAALLPNHASAGAERVVVTGVATPAEVPMFEDAVGGIQWVRLTADRAELHRRFTHRDGPDMLPDVDQHADELDASTFAALVIEATTTTPAEIAQRLDHACQPCRPVSRGWSSRRPSDPPRPDQGPSHPDQRPSRPDQRPGVVILTGPRTVGTSTVGWQLFMRHQLQEPTAFVDLAQIGFLNSGTDLTARHHRLRAANLAAIVSTYQQEGCRVVIAAGAVLSTEERDVYAAGLGSTPLTVVRLTATAAQLQQRVVARTAPAGGPHLAADDLRGQSNQAAKNVQAQALHEADQLERSDFADHVINTSAQSAKEAAEQIHNFLTQGHTQRSH